MGWKTYVGGIGAMLVGIGTAAQGLAAGEWSAIWPGLLVAFGGLAAVGLGHKVEKIKAVLEQFLGKKN